MEQKDVFDLVKKAAEGNRKALEQLLVSVNDIVFNLSLRMLGSVEDAKDASQDIMVKVMTHLSDFREESRFSTWVYRIAVNYLMNYRKSMFAAHPLDFEYYGNDIRYAVEDHADVIIDELMAEQMAEELKLSCTNVMLQCLDSESRVIFILGTMFHLDSRLAGEILDLSPDNYRQKLSRIRRKMADFLGEYCEWSGTGMCCCRRRVGYAASQGRVAPGRWEYRSLKSLKPDKISECMEHMEELDKLSIIFEHMPYYQAPEHSAEFVKQLLDSVQVQRLKEL